MTYRDNRYQPPRDRSPPPGRFGDRRPFGSRPTSPGSRDQRDAPRGPRAIDPSSRGGPGGFSTPRRGGLGPRTDSRDQRDGPMLNDPIRRPSWRDDREPDFDRRGRDRRSPLRERSPPRRRADSRDRLPSDLDIRRARRHSNDGPLSASSTLSDPLRFSGGQYRGASNRLTGRGNYDHRDRGRPLFLDERERDHLGPRSRSRGSRTERESDRWDDRREDGWRPSARDDREFDRARKDTPLTRMDSRPLGGPIVEKSNKEPSGPSDPGSLRAGQSHYDAGTGLETHSTLDRPKRAMSFQMNTSSLSEIRRDLERGEIPTPRTDPARDRPIARGPSPAPSSGPQVPPQVPAFGGSFLAKRPTTNVWRSPSLQQKPVGTAVETTQTTQALTVPTKVPGGQQVDIVAAPREPPTTANPSTEPAVHRADSAAVDPNPLHAATRTDQSGTAKLVSPVQPQQSAVSRYPGLFGTTSISSTLQSSAVAVGASDNHDFKRRKTSTPPRAPLADRVSHSPVLQQSPPSHHTALPASVPLGPRASSGSLGSPPNVASKIPTGPRASREPWLPPTAPRATNNPALVQHREPPRGPAIRSSQWIRPGMPQHGRPSLIPAKRDVHGGERSSDLEDRRPSPTLERSSVRDELPNIDAASSATRSEPDGVLRRRDTLVNSADTSLSTSTASKLTAGADVEMMDAPSADLPAKTLDAAKLLAEASESSDDDEELMNDMLNDIHAKHDRLYANVLAKKLDLTNPEYQAQHLLRRISLLNSIVLSDIRYLLPAKTVPQAVSLPTINPAPSMTPLGTPHKSSPTREQVLGNLLTPKAEDDDVTVEDVRTRAQKLVRPARDTVQRTPSPTLTSLPYLVREPPSPVSDVEQFRRVIDRSVAEKLERAFVAGVEADDTRESHLLEEYRQRYLVWRKEAEAMEKVEQEEAEARERLEREQAVGETPEPDAASLPLSSVAAATLPLPTPTEGRRSHRFASQLDLDLAIQASLESAKEDQAKQERETANVKPDPEKEANIPNMLTPHQIVARSFHDTNQARRPEHAIAFFDFVPPVDDFTPEEHELLVAGYKADPKAWGKIAQSLPGRTYKECINHYYQTKWTTDYKSLKDRRRKGIRTKRKILGGARSALTGLGDKEGDDQVSALTETGRPKRLAAPTFGEKEADADAANMAAKKPTMTEQATDGKTKKVRMPKGEGKKRRTQQQSLSGKLPGLSPTKNDKLQLVGATPAERTVSGAPEGLESYNVLPSLSADESTASAVMAIERHRIPSNDKTMMDIVPSIEVEGLSKEKGRGQNQTQRAGASSYWSVQEQTDFKRFVGFYGTDFQTISQLMGSKTHIMVKNYYERKKSDMPELVKAAEDANAKRKAGVSMGEPPTQSSVPRRRLDSVPPNAPRALAPVPDAALLDNGSTGIQEHLHASPRQSGSETRLSRLSPSDDTAKRYRQSLAGQLIAATSGMSPPTRSTIPTRGYFSGMDRHADARTRDGLQAAYNSTQARLHPRQDDAGPRRTEEQVRQHEMGQREQGELDRHQRSIEQRRRERESLMEESERQRQSEYMRAGSSRDNYRQPNAERGHEPDSHSEQSHWSGATSTHPLVSRDVHTQPRQSFRALDVRNQSELHGGTPALPNVYTPVYRNEADNHARAQNSPLYQASRYQAHQTQSRSEPRRSNLMDLLNTTSDAHDTSKQPSRMASSLPTTVPSPGVPGIATSTFGADGRAAGPGPGPGSGSADAAHKFPNSSYRSMLPSRSSAGASAPPSVPSAAREDEYAQRGHRDSWPVATNLPARQTSQTSMSARSTVAPPYRTNSPADGQHAQGMPVMREDYRSPPVLNSSAGHRSVLANIAGVSRGGPSPPPITHSTHSRTSSYSQPYGAEPRHSQHPHSMSQAPSISRVHTPPTTYPSQQEPGASMRLQPNPYANAQQQPSDRRYLPPQSQSAAHQYQYSSSESSRSTQHNRPAGVAAVNSVLRDPTEAARSRRLELDRAKELQRQEDVLARERESVILRESQREREQKDRDLERQRDYQRQQLEQSRRHQDQVAPAAQDYIGRYPTSSGRAHAAHQAPTGQEPHVYASALHDADREMSGLSQAGHNSSKPTQHHYPYPGVPAAYNEHQRDDRANQRTLQSQQSFEHGHYRPPGRDHEQVRRTAEASDEVYYGERYGYEPRPRPGQEQQHQPR